MTKYTKEEYNSIVKLHMPHTDPYVMGRIPQVKVKVNTTIDKVKAIVDITEDNNVKYLCEEIISDLEELKMEMHKL